VTSTFAIGGDLAVDRLGFGAMRITGRGIWGPPPDRDEAIRVVRRAYELGCNLIDTADSYGPHVSEELIAEALHPYPEDLVIATKGGLERTGPDVWPRNGDPAHLKRACEGSLRRLRVDRIDLYQLHAVDPDVPYAESVGALKELRDEGKIRHVGVSNVGRTQLAEARAIVDVVTVQNRFNLLDRGSERVLEVCASEGIGFIPWRPIETPDDGPVGEAAQRHGATPSQVALAWLLQRSPVMLPIPGTGSVAHLEDNVAARDLRLDAAEVAALDALAGER
jgi:pyridoxine 4-dehydrogenase